MTTFIVILALQGYAPQIVSEHVSATQCRAEAQTLNARARKWQRYYCIAYTRAVPSQGSSQD